MTAPHVWNQAQNCLVREHVPGYITPAPSPDVMKFRANIDPTIVHSTDDIDERRVATALLFAERGLGLRNRFFNGVTTLRSADRGAHPVALGISLVLGLR
ncbi:MAG: hypothetical protein ACE5HE_09625 [Phycisphaerae bacterium]